SLPLDAKPHRPARRPLLARWAGASRARHGVCPRSDVAGDRHTAAPRPDRRRLAPMARHAVRLYVRGDRSGLNAMRMLVTGSSGLIGSALIDSLTAGGHSVVRLVRAATGPSSDSIPWDPAAGKLDRTAIEGFDAVVHLAGEDISAGKWTAGKKAR